MYDGKGIQETTEKDMINEKDGYYNLVTIDTENPIHVPKDEKTSEIPSKKDTDNNNSDSGIDDEFYDSLECIEAIRRLKGQDISSTGKDAIITFQSEKTNTWDTLAAGCTDIMDPLASNRRLVTTETSLNSPADTGYWNPINDYYRNKETNDKVSDDFLPQENISAGYESDSSTETGSVSSTELDPWEYWDPVDDCYRSKKTNDRVSDDFLPQEDISARYESDSSTETSSVSSTKSDPWEYWDR